MVPHNASPNVLCMSTITNGTAQARYSKGTRTLGDGRPAKFYVQLVRKSACNMQHAAPSLQACSQVKIV